MSLRPAEMQRGQRPAFRQEECPRHVGEKHISWEAVCRFENLPCLPRELWWQSVGPRGRGEPGQKQHPKPTCEERRMAFLLTKIIKGLTCYLFLDSFYPVCSRVFLRHDRPLAALLGSVRPHGGTGQDRRAFVERLFGEERGSTDACVCLSVSWW